MDEPTAALTDQEIGHLYTIIHALRAAGMTVVYVIVYKKFSTSQSRITVMRNGRVVMTAATTRAGSHKVDRVFTGRDSQMVFPASTATSVDRW